MAIPIKPPNQASSTPQRKPPIRAAQKQLVSQDDEFELPDLNFSDPEQSKKPKTTTEPPTKSQVRKKPPVAYEAAKVEEIFNEKDNLDNESEEGWAIDEKTGLKYKTMPKSVYKGKGAKAVPVLLIPDFDADNMTGEAETYLKHLRVPPDKEEQARLRDLKARQRREQESDYSAIHAEALKEKAAIEDEEPEKKKSMFNILNWFR